jgi:hypothetical protein
MGRNKVVIDDNHCIIFGFDAPCNGYFAQYFDMTSEQYKLCDEPSEEIGFFKGVSKNRVIEMFEKYDAVKQAREQKPDAWMNLCMDLPC